MVARVSSLCLAGNRPLPTDLLSISMVIHLNGSPKIFNKNYCARAILLYLLIKNNLFQIYFLLGFFFQKLVFSENVELLLNGHQ